MTYPWRAPLVTMSILIGVLSGACGSNTGEVSRLTAAMRAAYGLEPTDAPLPISTLAQMIPDGLTPDSVVVLLQPIQTLAVAERWVTGHDAAGDRFQAHIVAFSLPRGTPFEVVFRYREDRLVDIDLPEYLGRTTAFEPVEGGWPRLVTRAT